MRLDRLFLNIFLFNLLSCLFLFYSTPLHAEEKLSDREKFLRKFSNDPSNVKASPAPTPTPTDETQIETGTGTGQVQNVNLDDNYEEEGETKPSFGDLPKTGKIDLNELLKKVKGPQKKLLEMTKNMFADKDGKMDVEKLKEMQKMEPKELMKKMETDIKSGKVDFSKAVKAITGTVSGQSDESIAKNLKTGKLGPLFKSNPRLVKFVIKVMKDDTALLQLSKILENKKGLGMYFGFFIFTLLFGFGLKKFINRGGSAGVITELLRTITRFFIINSMRFGAFVFLFGKNLAPTWGIFQKVFFK